MLRRCRRRRLRQQQEIVPILIGRHWQDSRAPSLCESWQRTTQQGLTDTAQYTGPKELKGPDDFAGKGGGDDDDEEENGSASPQQDNHTPPEPAAYSAQFPSNRASFHHVRGATPSASPPLPNGNLRRPSPQPRPVSRPSSRASMPRRSSHAPQPTHSNPPQAQMNQAGYAYAQTQHYHPQQYPSEHDAQRYQPQHADMSAMSRQPQNFPEPYLRVQQAYEQDQPRQSMPHAIQAQNWHQQDIPQPQPSPQPRQQLRNQHSPRINESHPSPPLPQPKPSPVPSKSHSIFTPIEESRSLLAQHWQQARNSDTASADQAIRAQSIDVAALANVKAGSVSPKFPQPSQQQIPTPLLPPRSASTVSLSSVPQTARSSTFGSDARRPRLTVKIPTEASEADEDTESSSAHDANASVATQPAKGVVLPPPSPSANNPLLSAGAAGPPNPFARPAPPNTQSGNKELETPLSALPSRVMEGNMLPSPSDIWGNMFSRTNTDNSMVSPLNFGQTPTVSNGAGFKDEPEDRKRKADDDLASTDEKRVKS